MPFDYGSGWVNPYGVNMADTIARSGDAAAHAAAMTAQAQAQAAQIKGQVWGHAIAQAGQFPAQVQALRDQETDRTLKRMQVQTAVEGKLELQKQHMATTVGALAKTSESAEDFAAHIDGLVGLGGLPPQVGDLLKQQAAGPGEWAPKQKRYVDLAAQYAKNIKVGKGEKVINEMTGATVADNPEPMKLSPGQIVVPETGGPPIASAPFAPGTGQHVVNGQVVGPEGQSIGAPVPKQETPTEVATGKARVAELESRKKELDAKLAGTLPMSPEERARLGLDREKLKAEIEHWRRSDSLDNPEAPVSEMAKAIANYQVGPPNRTTDKGIALMNQVMRVNPAYDGTQFPNRSRTRIAYTTGSQGQQLTALNTALEHLGKLDEVVDAVGNGSFKPGNEVYNWLSTTFGSKAATNLQFARDIMAGELATAMKKSGATDQEISKVTSSLSTAGSPEQLHGAIRDIALPMIAGKASTLDQQYKAAMGENDPFSVYTPGAKKVIEKFKSGDQAAGGFIEAKDPQGTIHHAPAGTSLPAGWTLVKR